MSLSQTRERVHLPLIWVLTDCIRLYSSSAENDRQKKAWTGEGRKDGWENVFKKAKSLMSILAVSGDIALARLQKFYLHPRALWHDSRVAN